MSVRNKVISAAVVIPVLTAAPAMAEEPTPDPSITGPAPTPIETTPAPEPIVTSPTPEPVAEAPVSPAASFSAVPVAPAPKRAAAGLRTSRAGMTMRTRNTRYSPLSAVYRLMQWARQGRSGYHNGCLRLADDAYSPSGGRTSTALRQWYRAKRAGYGHHNRQAPIGAQLFWRTSHPAGHVATYIGRDLVVTNVGSGRVKIMPWRALDRWGPYLGWAEPYYS